MDELKILLGTMIDKSSLTNIQKQLAKEKISMNVDLNFAKALKESKDDIKKLSKQFGEMFNLSDREALSFTKEYISKSTQLIKEETRAQESLVNSMTKGREASEKAYQAEKKRQELAQSGAINKAADQEYASKQKLIEQMARGREQSELAAKAEQKRQELAQATASNKSADQKYKQEAIEAEKVAASVSKINQVIASGSNEVKIEQLTTKFRSLGLSTEEIQKRLFGVNNAFNALKGSSDNASLITNAKLLDSEYEKVNNQIKQTTASLSGLTTESQRLTKLNSIKTYADNNSKAAKAMKNDFAQMYAQLNNPNLTISGLRDVDAQFKSLKLSARDTGLMGETLGDSFSDMGKKFTSWITVSSGVMLVWNQIRSGGKFVAELDDALSNINYTMDVTKSQLAQIGNSAVKMGKDLNTSATNVLSAVKLYANANETAESILQKAQPAVMLSNVTGMTGEESAKTLQAVMNQFDLTQDDLLQVTDTLESVSQNMSYDYASGIKEISEAISESGLTAKMAGLNLQEYASILGVVIEKSGQSGGTVGNAFKTILSRITSASKGMGTLDEDISNAEKSFKSVGIQIRSTDGEFRDMTDIMSDLATKWSGMTDVEKSNISFYAAGTRQVNILKSLLENWDEYENVVSKANDSAGTTLKTQDTYAESLKGHLGELSAVGQSAWNNVLNSNQLKSGVDLLTGLASGVDKLTSVIGGLGTVVSGIGLYNFIKNFQQLKSIGEITTVTKSFNAMVVSGTGTNLTFANALKTVDAQTKINIVTQSALTREQKLGVLATSGLSGEELKVAVSTTTLSAAEGSATIATNGFSTALKGLWTAFKANPIAIIITALTIGITIWDKYKQVVEESKKALENSVNTYKNAKSELESINTELETQSKRLDELLSKDKLTYAEQGELENLKEITKELQIQQKLKDEETNRAAREAAKIATKSFVSDYRDNSATESGISAYSSVIDQAGGVQANLMESSDMSALIAAYIELNKLKEESKDVDDESYEDYSQKSQFVKDSIFEQVDALQKLKDSLSSVPLEQLTSDQKQALDEINASIKTAFSYLDSNQWNEIQINDIFNTDGIEKTKDELIQLAKDGKLDSETIESYTALNDAIKNSDLILQNGENSVSAFKKEIDALASSDDTLSSSQSDLSRDFSTMFSNLPTDKLEEYISLLNSGKINESTISTYSDLNELIKESGISAEDAVKSIKDYAEGFTSSTDLISNIQSAYDLLKATTEEYQKNGQIGLSSLESIANKYPELRSAVNSYVQGLISADDMMAQLQTAYNNDAEAFRAAMAYKMQGNETFFDTIKQNNTSLFTALASAYGDDVLNWKTLAQAKADIDKSLISQLADMWGKYYGSFNANIVKGKDGQYSVTSDDPTAIYESGYQAIEEEVAKRNQMVRALNEAANVEIKIPNFGGIGSSSSKSGSSGSKDKTKKDFSEIFDWVSITIDRVNEKIENLKDKISDANGWKSKNAITGTALDEISSKVTALESQLNTYQGRLTEAGSKLSESYIDKIKNGTLEVETVTDEVISKNIKEYQDWYDKINDVNKELDSTKKVMKELAKSKLDNIINDFESLTSLMDKYSSYSSSLLNLQKSLGEEITNADYEQLINQQGAIYDQLQKEYNSLSSELSKAVSAGTIKIGTEEWRKYNGELIDINSSMNDAVSSMNDFRKTLMDLPFEQLTTVANEFNRINSGIETMMDVMGSGGTTDNGMITAKGLTQIALYGKQLANSKQLAAEYANAIDELNQAYEDGSITQAEYNDKLSEFTSAQLSAVKATKYAEDAIIQFRKTAIQEQIDDYNKLIDAKKKVMQEDNTYANYLDEVAEKQKKMSVLQAKIDELSTKSDASDRSAIAMRLQLENDLAEAKKDLSKTQADYAYDQTLDSLDKQAEKYQDAKEKELDELESSYDAQQKVIEDYLGQVKDNYKTVYNTLSKYGTDYNIEMTSDLVSPWESANTAVDTFQSAVSDAIAQINIDIASLDLSKLTEMVSTMSGFFAAGNGSSFEDITGTGTWHKNKTGDWYGSSDDDYASDGVYTIGGKQYSFNEDGYMKTGWNDDSGSWRYFEPENGQMVKSTWRKGKDGKDYYLTSDGAMATDTAVKAKSGNGYYYVDGDGVWDGKSLSYDDVKKKDISVSYKNGTDSTVSGLKNVGEDDIEELIVTKNGAILSSKGQDTVFTGSRTDVLRDFSKDPTSYITDKLMRNQMDLNSVKMVNRSASSVIQLNSPLMTVNNTDENTMNLLNNRLNVFATSELPNVIQQNMRSY